VGALVVPVPAQLQAPKYGGVDAVRAAGVRVGSPVQFSYRKLQRSTKGFKEKLGPGRFDAVYRGVLANRTVVAVKQLEGIEQGEKQFRMEVATISRNHHLNLVRLIGFCSEGRHRLLVNPKDHRHRTLTSVRGTRGYLAPEWLANLPITAKSDVYSYGMVLLETVSGQRNFDVSKETRGKKFSVWTYEEYERGNLAGIIDRRLPAEDLDMAQVERALQVSFWCIQVVKNSQSTALSMSLAAFLASPRLRQASSTSCRAADHHPFPRGDSGNCHRRKSSAAVWCVSEARRRREEREGTRRESSEHSRRWDGGCLNGPNCRSLLVIAWSCPF
jgi:hypothetical protein